MAMGMVEVNIKDEGRRKGAAVDRNRTENVKKEKRIPFFAICYILRVFLCVKMAGNTN